MPAAATGAEELLALNLDILPSLVSETTALASGDGEAYSGQG